ncbi:MAG: helix-turn-helix transcriptional regulator [Candidatus Bathyarchaeota archaeon]|nr:helix-turn-helix domain-containing protein [Candidatus Bathyarchaeum tardum]WGM89284.1 MAG: helix-turn-helix domain-containing protein [Candidatus Bathyarchaeum tardum]WNZ28433.1 MAG: helix-turn-helix transcriptional regulator [Candidatus Bathyarchaeota archaeon]
MERKAVQVIEDLKTIKILADPLRREIIRETANQPQTQSQLAKKLELTPSSTMYHLKKLRESGLMEIEHSEVGTYGILEKYYEPTANLFIENYKKTSLKLQKYFLHTHVERLRGMLATLQLIAEKKGKSVEIKPEDLYGMAQDIANVLPEIGKKFEHKETDENRESLIVKIYAEALNTISNGKWRDLCTDIL